jgi:hypothetical protein
VLRWLTAYYVWGVDVVREEVLVVLVVKEDWEEMWVDGRCHTADDGSFDIVGQVVG